MHFKKYGNLFNRLIRQAKALYYTELFETHKESIKGTWRVLNDVIGKHRDKTCCTSMNIDGQSITNAASISRKLVRSVLLKFPCRIRIILSTSGVHIVARFTLTL